MRVFVLSTGRCGSVTFAKACGHITNYTTGHESKAAQVAGRLAYPNQHIEVDNRLSWFLGSLDQQYHSDVFYVHLLRDPEQVAESYAHRFHIKAGIMPAFCSGILRRGAARNWERMHVARLYVETVNQNIHHFLKGKSNSLQIRLENPTETFATFWRAINAQGNLSNAQAEFSKRYNASKKGQLRERNPHHHRQQKGSVPH